jgi:hypothetical protein
MTDVSQLSKYVNRLMLIYRLILPIITLHVYRINRVPDVNLRSQGRRNTAAKKQISGRLQVVTVGILTNSHHQRPRKERHVEVLAIRENRFLIFIICSKVHDLKFSCLFGGTENENR